MDPSPTSSPRALHHSVLGFLQDLPGTAKRFWVLVLLTGLMAGLFAVLLVQVLKAVQHLAWSTHGDSFQSAVLAGPWLRRLWVPTLAGCLVTAVSLAVRQPLRGHGTAGIIEAIWTRSGRLPLLRTLLRGTVSIGAVAMGAPLGREGALLQMGAATASALARRLRIPADQARLLVACGAASGIAAAYNVPIGAAIFGLEVLLQSFALELFGPIVFSCVVATLVSRILIADHPSYVIPHYKLLAPREVFLGVLFGPLLGVASALYNRVIRGFSEGLEKLPQRLAWLLPPLAMLLTGIAALWLPQLLGNGYDSVNGALLGELPLFLLLLLPLAKMLATALCAAAGVPGGLFTPSLFYGALIGGALGYLAPVLVSGAAPPGTYALLGMGAVLAGTTHASVSSVLIIFEMTGDYGVILPLMLTAVVAAAVSRQLEPESLYTAVLKRRKVSLPGPLHPNWLRSADVRALMKPSPARVAPDTRFEALVVELLELPRGVDLYVTSREGRYLGAIILDALKGHLPDHSLLSMTVAADVMDTGLHPVLPELSLSEVALRFSELPLEQLPVVDAQGILIGTISKGDVLRQGRF